MEYVWKRNQGRGVLLHYHYRKKDLQIALKYSSTADKAGTWEEKPITKKMFEDFFNDYLKKNEKKYKDVFVLDEISGYSGEVRKNNIFNFILFLLNLDLFRFHKRKNKVFL